MNIIPPNGPARETALAAWADRARTLTRISLINTQDFTQAFNLVKALLIHPDSVSCIKEITICIDVGNNNRIGSARGGGHPPNRTWELHATATGESVILQNCIKTLRLGPDCDAAAFKAIGVDPTICIPQTYNDGVFVNDEHGQVPYTHPDEAIAIILLWACRNLETVQLGLSFPIHSAMDQYLTLANYGLLPGLAKVKRVEFVTPKAKIEDYRYYEESQPFIQFQWVHRLPRIESVSIIGAEAAIELRLDWFVPRCGKMKRLEITHSSYGTGILSALISIPEELEELKISLGGLFELDGRGPFIPRQLHNALLNHKQSLTFLDIDTERSTNTDRLVVPGQYIHESDMRKTERKESVYQAFKLQDTAVSKQHMHDATRPTDEELTAPVWPSFADFKNLKHLRIGLHSLLGAFCFVGETGCRLPDFGVRLVDQFPASLESLTLYDYERGLSEDADRQIDELLALKEDRFPRLKHLDGVESKIKSLQQLYGHYDSEDSEEMIWDHGEQDWSWK